MNTKLNDKTSMKIDEINEMKVEVGTKEAVSLKPAMVEIVDITLETKGDKGSKILVCSIKHPDSENNVKLSGIQWINPKTNKLEDNGLWFNLDDEKKIRKGSSLALFLELNKVANISGLMNKKFMTCFDMAKQYLVFKGY